MYACSAVKFHQSAMENILSERQAKKPIKQLSIVIRGSVNIIPAFTNTSRFDSIVARSS